MEPIGFHGILILPGVAVVLAALFRYLRPPQILAYLCAGIVVGPHGMGRIPDLEGTRTLAEFGLVFLKRWSRRRKFYSKDSSQDSQD
jgi:CPA2 family monovalent cation:H+ antiporter-2